MSDARKFAAAFRAAAQDVMAPIQRQFGAETQSAVGGQANFAMPQPALSFDAMRAKRDILHVIAEVFEGIARDEA